MPVPRDNVPEVFPTHRPADLIPVRMADDDAGDIVGNRRVAVDVDADVICRDHVGRSVVPGLARDEDPAGQVARDDVAGTRVASDHVGGRAVEEDSVGGIAHGGLGAACACADHVASDGHLTRFEQIDPV